MKIKMKVQITGSRDGVRWPPPGSEVELPDHEGAKLCAAGLATPVADKDAGVEKAVVSEKSETRGSTRKTTDATAAPASIKTTTKGE